MTKFTLLRYHLLASITGGKKRRHYRHKIKALKEKVSRADCSTQCYEITGQNNQLFFYDEHGHETVVPFYKVEGIQIHINGSHNIIKIPNPKTNLRSYSVHLSVLGNHNVIDLHKGIGGNWTATAYGDNNVFDVGENTSCGDFAVSLHSNTFKIGKNCMISAKEQVWTDGHTVMDSATNQVLNKPNSPILIGNHVWVGRQVIFTKGAQVPDNCIIGIGSVVTKKFTEPNCVIAGNPARVVKTGISWNGRRPLVYEQGVQNNYNPIIPVKKTKPTLFFVHCADNTNIGDMLCTPVSLFDSYKKTHNQIIMDIREDMPLYHLTPDDVIILGGGGLLNYSDDWNKRINQLLALSSKVIAWGTGFNTHYDDTASKLPINYERFCLLGIRDWFGDEKNYCPCVSCLNPNIHQKYPTIRTIGIVEHKENPIPLEYERISNCNNCGYDIFSFIASSEVIITNTYHGAYWGLLMGKKVITYHPFSNRFDRFKYPPVVYSGDLAHDISIAKTYPDFLNEAIALNNAFFKKVQNIIRQDGK